MQSSKSPLKSFSLLALAFFLGVGSASGGYWLVVVFNGTDQLDETIQHIAPIRSDSVVPTQNDMGVESSSSTRETVVLQDIDDLEQIKSTFERELALRNFLAASDESTVAKILAKSRDPIFGGYQYGVRTAVIQRFAQLNPKRALSHVLEMNPQSYPSQFIGVIFREWAQYDLDEAVATVHTFDNRHYKEFAVRAILEERKDLSEDLLRSIARDIGNEQIANAIITQQKIDKAIVNPERAWNELAMELQNDVQYSWNIARIATAWVEQSGLGVLDQIVQTITNAEVRQHVLSNVLQGVANSDPAEAFRYALNIEDDPHNSITDGVVRTWAESNPKSALSAVLDIDKAPLRNSLMQTIVWTWAYKDPEGILKDLSMVPEDVQPEAVSNALSVIARNSPEQAANRVTGLGSEAAKKAAAASVAGTWAHQDAEAALAWIMNEPSIEELQPELINSVLYSLVHVDPQLAMDTALSQPIEEDGGGKFMGMTHDSSVGMEVNVISVLAHSNLNKAIELLPQVREGSTKLHAYFSVGTSLVLHGDTEEALALAHQIAESDRTEYFTSVARVWANSDPEGLLNSMNRFPSREDKSKAALALLSINQFSEGLTDDQVKETQKFLSEEDAEALNSIDSRGMMYRW